MNAAGGLISYEEYSPYGSTIFQAGRSAAEVGLKRYRYTGKERDEESGLHYHGARYYAAWLGRWTRCDPEFVPGKGNLYVYVSNSPAMMVDNSGRAEGKPLFTEEHIAEALDKGSTSKEGAYKRKPFRLDIDEKHAVQGVKAGGVSGSPTAPEEKHFMDYMTNEVSKKNYVSDAPEPRIGEFIVPPVDAPEEVRKAAGEKIAVAGFDKADEI